MSLGLILTFEEVRAFLHGLVLDAQPTTEQKITTFYAASELVRAIVAKNFSRAQWKATWERLFGPQPHAAAPAVVQTLPNVTAQLLTGAKDSALVVKITVGAGGINAGTQVAKVTFGTGVFLLANVGTVPVRPSSGLTCSVAWNLRGGTAYCVDGQAYTAASAVRWITDLGLISAPTDLDAVAADDADGVLFVPALAGLAAPWWRPEATATFTGMTLSHNRAHLVAAVVDGLAAQTAELLSAVGTDLATPLTALRVDGGLTRSARLMQATANLTGLPIEVYPSAHATALGAAACARMATDPALDIADAVPAWAPERTYEPAWPTERANEFRARWRAAVAAGLPEENTHA